MLLGLIPTFVFSGLEATTMNTRSFLQKISVKKKRFV